MPNLAYSYVPRAAIGFPGVPTCPGGPAAALTALPNPIAPTWPQLYAAQVSIGVFPPGWAARELTWRLSSLRLSSVNFILSPSPVMQLADPTEKAQMSYHLGTAAGICTALGTLAPAPGGIYFPMLLTRAMSQGAIFNFANLQRADVLFFDMTIPPPLVAPPVFNNFVVWECKGHANNVGQAPLNPALAQATALTGITTLPGGAVLPFAAPPACYVASQIDVHLANYRLQITDPPNPGDIKQNLNNREMNLFLKTFYEPYMELFRGKASGAIKDFPGHRFYDLELLPNIRIGIDKDLFDIILEDKNDLCYEVGAILNNGFNNQDADRYWINSFGISVELENGWQVTQD